MRFPRAFQEGLLLPTVVTTDRRAPATSSRSGGAARSVDHILGASDAERAQISSLRSQRIG